jgi:hypothetical protein
MTKCEICNCDTKKRVKTVLNKKEFKICSNCNCNLKKKETTQPKRTVLPKFPQVPSLPVFPFVPNHDIILKKK